MEEGRPGRLRTRGLEGQHSGLSSGSLGQECGVKSDGLAGESDRTGSVA